MTTFRSESGFEKYIQGVIAECGGYTTHHEDQHLTGIADTSYGLKGVNGWIEFKFKSLEFRPKQPLWLMHQARSGGHTFMMGWYSGYILMVNWRFHTYWCWPDNEDAILPLTTALVAPELHRDPSLLPPPVRAGKLRLDLLAPESPQSESNLCTVFPFLANQA
jgi:hypothetical protein